MSTDTEIVLDEKISLDIKEPKKCKVVFLNDDGTPMDFVVDVLQKNCNDHFAKIVQLEAKITVQEKQIENLVNENVKLKTSEQTTESTTKQTKTESKKEKE